MAGSSTSNPKLANQLMNYDSKIVDIPQPTTEISQELQQILNSATEAFNTKSYKLAAKHFKSAVNSMILKDREATDQTLILTKYMMCSCWLQSTDAKDLSDGLKILEELERNYSCIYPMLYYAVARAYFKLYRFNKADEILKKGFAVLNGDVKIVEYYIPGTKIIIPESSKERLVAALVKLNDQCSGWHRPDAVCCMPDCSAIGHNEGADKNIFFGSPTFNGMVQVTCNNPSNVCTMSFHLACWKAKKEEMCSLGKISDKEVLHAGCFTPNCENEGVHCMIKKIEIFDENAEVKATIAPRPEDLVWHAKPTPPPKGAIRKQQQQPKLKVGSNESRPPVERHPRPLLAANELTKVNETEEEDDLHDEMALKMAMEDLKELRAANFYIRDDMIWRPDLSMYGNEYMLATAEALPDPDFSNDDTEQQEKKSFIFSYFYTFLSNNSPIKLDVLEVKWNEAKNIIEHCDSILKHHLDIKEFLLQSLKFSVVGNYICTADKLPDAYHMAKTDACEIVKIFMEHDIDQQSSSSSIDDEAIFNDIINQEKNNNSPPYSTIPEDDKSVTDKSTIPSKLAMDTTSNNDENHTDGPKNSKIVGQEIESNEIQTEAPMNVPEMLAVETTPNRGIVDAEKPVISKTSIFSNGKVSTPNKKNVQKCSHSPYLPLDVRQSSSAENNVIKVQQECVEKLNIFKGEVSPKPTLNGTYNVNEIENQLRNATSQPLIVPDKFVKETKSTGDLETHVDSLENIHGPLINHSGGLNKMPTSTEENFPRGSKKNNEKKRCMKEPETRASIIAELGELHQEMSEELAKMEIEELRSEFAQARKVNEAMRRRMLQKILHGQYAYNDAVINLKLQEAKKNYDTISGIQQMLATSIDGILPINGLDWIKIITELNKISANNQNKFVTLNDQLCAATDLEKLQEMELPLEKLPDLPKCDLIDIIQSAFGMYRMHQMKEFQKLQLLPNPQPQVQPLFRTPQKYAQTIDYQQTYTFQNTPGLAYSPSQLHRPFIHASPPFMHATATQQTFHIPLQQQQQQIGLPLISNQSPHPLMFPTCGLTKIAEPFKHESIILENRNFSPQQSPHASVEQPAPYHANTSSADVPTNFKFPITKLEKIAIEQNFSTVDQQNGKNSEKTKNFPSQQQLSASFSEQPKVISAQQRTKLDATQQNSSVLKEFKDLSSNFYISPESNAQASGISSGATGEKNVQDRNSKWNDNVLALSNVQSEINMHIVEAPLNYDTYANPEKHEKDDKMIDNETIHEHFTEASGVRKEIKLQKKTGHSMDKLMQRLRSQYPGVLEMDLLKSVECVRQKHNNSLSRMPILRIIRKADKFIVARQQKQLCGYEKHQNYVFAVQHPNAWNYEGERKRQNSISSTSSVNSCKQGPFPPKKKWEPVTIPNDGWIKETQESECAICLETMPISAKSYSLQCKHTFHMKCIKNWYQHNQSCPTCRVHSTIDDEYPPLPLG